MSNKPDTKETAVSFEEKFTWVSAVVSAAVAAVYCTVVLRQLGEVPAAEIAYRQPMLIAVGAMIVLTIVGTIVTAIGTAVAAEITGNGSVKDIDRKDERDVQIGRRGLHAGSYVISVGALGVLGLAMLEQDYFWIANALYLTFVVSGLVSSAVKLVAYRRGF
jgi:hypothetical protein